jgi:hypothetical protein
VELRGEEIGKTTDQQLELAAAKRRIKELETELAVARKINEVFLKEGISPKRLFPVIESLTGRGSTVDTHAGRSASRSPAITRGTAEPTRRERCGGSGLSERSPTSTRHPAGPTGR